MKICLIHTYQKLDLPAYNRYFNQVRDSAMKAKRPDTELDFRWLDPGLKRTMDPLSIYFGALSKISFLERAFEAGKEGFDAIVALFMEESGIEEAKEILEIPVVGEAEAGMLLACMLGNKFAMITGHEPKWIALAEEKVALHGLQSRAVYPAVERLVIPDGMTYDEMYKKEMEEGGYVARAAIEAARNAVKRGADVAIAASTGMSAAITAAGVSKLEENNVPIIDIIAAAVKMAELRVDLGRSFGLPAVSRAWKYTTFSNKDINRVRKLFGYPEI